jgi:hypothetical protein
MSFSRSHCVNRIAVSPSRVITGASGRRYCVSSSAKVGVSSLESIMIMSPQPQRLVQRRPRLPGLVYIRMAASCSTDSACSRRCKFLACGEYSTSPQCKPGAWHLGQHSSPEEDTNNPITYFPYSIPSQSVTRTVVQCTAIDQATFRNNLHVVFACLLRKHPSAPSATRPHAPSSRR